MLYFRQSDLLTLYWCLLMPHRNDVKIKCMWCANGNAVHYSWSLFLPAPFDTIEHYTYKYWRYEPSEFLRFECVLYGGCKQNLLLINCVQVAKYLAFSVTKTIFSLALLMLLLRFVDEKCTRLIYVIAWTWQMTWHINSFVSFPNWSRTCRILLTSWVLFLFTQSVILRCETIAEMF